MLNVELILAIALAAIAGAAVAYFFLRGDEDDKTTMNLSPPLKLRPNGGGTDEALAYDPGTGGLTIVLSPPGANDANCSWHFNTVDIGGVTQYVLYSNALGAPNYLGRSFAGGRTQPVLSRGVDPAVAWNIVGLTVLPDSSVVLMSPDSDMTNPQGILAVSRAGTTIDIRPYDPGISDFVWKAVRFP